MPWARIVDGLCHEGPQTKKPGCQIVDADCWQGLYGAAGWQYIEEADVAGLEYWTPPKTTAQRVAEAFIRYDTQRKDLERQLADAVNFFQDAEYADMIRADLVALDGEYMTEVGVIVNG